MKSSGNLQQNSLTFFVSPMNVRILKVYSRYLHFYLKNKTLIAKAEEHCKMNKMKADTWNFQNFEYARYATGILFQQANYSSRNTAEGKEYFAGKYVFTVIKSMFEFYQLGFLLGVRKSFQILYHSWKNLVKTTAVVLRHPKAFCGSWIFRMKDYFKNFEMINGKF